MTLRFFASAMETETTVVNAAEYLPTDWQPSVLQESSTDPNRRRSHDDCSYKVSKNSVGPRSSSVPHPRPILNNSLPSLSEESSELPATSERTTSSSLILAGGIRNSQPQRSGNVMSEKQLSSPSSSASVKSPNSRGSNNGNGDEPYLAVQKQPPKHVYSNESFEVTLQLEIPKAASIAQSSFGSQEIELVASLHNEKTGRGCGPEALLITEPSRIVLTPDQSGVHRCIVVCMIRMDGIRRDQGAFLSVRFKPRPDSSPPIRGIAWGGTNAINIVNYKIRITLEEDWGPVWYKDEGGRDKSMEIYAAIYDKDGQLRTGEQIPLHPCLCYESSGNLPVKVSNQEILRMLGTSRVVIDKDTGRARIRFRVEDVSKNHQAQDFVLMVGTDPKAKTFQDVAPDFTPAVNVRSKRNKRSRNPAHSRSSSEVSKRTSPAVNRPRYEEQQESSSTVFDAADIPRLRDALKSVVNWADEVVNGLYPLQWQVLGYAQHPDGSTDYSRPYHNMPNPNPCIDRIIGMYSDTVRESLRVLLSSVEQASPQSDDPESIMPVPIIPPPPRQFGEDPMYGMMRSPQPMQMHGYPGMPPQPAPRRPVMPGGHEPYQEGSDPSMMYQPRPMMHHPQHQGMPPTMHAYMRAPPPPEGDMMPMHLGMPPRAEMPQMGVVPGDVPMQRSLRPEDESRESEVEYVLAKQYKALRTGERLGFPAYSGNKEILGFYRETGSGARQFSQISRHRNDFGPLEILQATEILEGAIKKKSDAVHSLKDWGTIDNLLNQALVYDWRQDIGND